MWPWPYRFETSIHWEHDSIFVIMIKYTLLARKFICLLINENVQAIVVIFSFKDYALEFLSVGKNWACRITTLTRGFYDESRRVAIRGYGLCDGKSNRVIRVLYFWGLFGRWGSSFKLQLFSLRVPDVQTTFHAWYMYYASVWIDCDIIVIDCFN